jgi:uncharacterized protein (UPF0248 family)
MPVIPIRELLNRIRWDPEFGKGDFVVGYYDRVEDRILRVPISELRFDPEDHFAVEVAAADGEFHSVPLHRVKEVHKDGELIWRREH